MSTPMAMSISTSMPVLHVRVHCAYPYPCCISMFMLLVHVRAACSCHFCMSMMMLRVRFGAAYKCSQCMPMSVLYVRAACSFLCCISMSQLVHAASRASMLHVYCAASPCCVLLRVQHAACLAACPLCMSLCCNPWCMSLLHANTTVHVHGACPCSLSIY